MTENYTYKLAERAIAGILTDEEQAKLDVWLSESAENRTDFAEIKSILEMSNATMSAISPETDAEWGKLEQLLFAEDTAVDSPIADAAPEKKVIPFYASGRNWAVAAAIALLASIGIYFLNTGGENAGVAQLYASNLGEQKQVNLSDGSKVSLNGSSKIETSADYGVSSRHLSLVGEAYFEVAEDKEKPFVVTAGKTTAEALGTKFNVRKANKSEEVQLSVVEGKVRFSDTEKHQELILVANQVAHFDALTGKLVMDAPNAADEAGWRLNKLIFKDVAFPKAAERIGRQYGVELQFPDRLNSARLTANFEGKELSQVLEVLESIYTVKATKAGEIVTLAD